MCPDGTDLTQLSAEDAADAIRNGRLASESLVRSFLDRIEARDADVDAWAFLDGNTALAQARNLDWLRKSGRATGSLHGVPVGLKDVVDTRAFPTECGPPVHKGNHPARDAALVERLVEAGAVIMGKTRTCELAFMHPTTTNNPHDRSRSPGGSSAGSAAAVADRQVMLAVGTQTNGSVIRPASFCGVFGFKPSRGMISRRGVLQTAKSLDQVGVFGHSLGDVALLVDALSGYDPADTASLPRPRPSTFAGSRAAPPVPPDLAWFDLPWHSRLDNDARAGYEAVLEALGPRVERFDAAPQLADLTEVHATIHLYEFLHYQAPLIRGHWHALTPTLQQMMERARGITTAEYEHALAVKDSAESFFGTHFNDFDAILAPAAAGEAPLLAEGTTGDPVFCTVWTLAGLPALAMPVLVGRNGLPIGLQLIGGIEEDDRLLRTATWLQAHLSKADCKQEREG